jgi:hypothetical protein
LKHEMPREFQPVRRWLPLVIEPSPCRGKFHEQRKQAMKGRRSF